MLRSLPANVTKVFCIDGVNSMTGNAPDLPLYARICREYDALLYVDDAHGFGIMGESPTPDMPYGYRGNSIVRYYDESYENLVLVAGFSKSYSSLAAFLALPTSLKNYLKVAAPPYLYSGPSPTASLATVLAGFDVNELEGDDIRRSLCQKTRRVLDQIANSACGRSTPRGTPSSSSPWVTPMTSTRWGGSSSTGDLRHAGPLPAGAPVSGGFPCPGDGGQRRQPNRPAKRGASRALPAFRHAAGHGPA